MLGPDWTIKSYLILYICIKDRKNIWFLTLQDNLKDWWQSFVLHIYFFFEYKREVSNHLGSYLWEKKIPRLRKWWTGLPVIFSILWISSSSTFELPNLSKIKRDCTIIISCCLSFISGEKHWPSESLKLLICFNYLICEHDHAFIIVLVLS